MVAASDRLAARHGLGVVLMLASAVAFSTAGFFTRAIPLAAPGMLFWRGIFSGLAILSFVAWRRRGRPWPSLATIEPADVLLTVVSSAAMISFLWSLRLSSVAEVSIIYATLPLVTAGLSWLLLREPAGGAMLLASGACVAGMAVMMRGAEARAHLSGDLVAGGMTLITGLMVVGLRWRRERDNMPALAASAFLTSVAMAAWADPLAAPAGAVATTALFGVVQNGLGIVLMTVGARYVTATETALYGALDAPLAPLWVWLAFGETPGAATVTGGAIVVAAVMAFIAHDRRPSAAPVGHNT